MDESVQRSKVSVRWRHADGRPDRRESARRDVRFSVVGERAQTAPQIIWLCSGRKHTNLRMRRGYEEALTLSGRCRRRRRRRLSNAVLLERWR